VRVDYWFSHLNHTDTRLCPLELSRSLCPSLELLFLAIPGGYRLENKVAGLVHLFLSLTA